MRFGFGNWFHVGFLAVLAVFELVPMIATSGKIFELRLMIEFIGAHRSYCSYVFY